LDRKRLNPAIVVGAKSKLDTVLVTLIAAAKAGELDEGLEAARNAAGWGIPKRKLC
jgi:hypothetical protein